jgi:hypothetical protein
MGLLISGIALCLIYSLDDPAVETIERRYITLKEATA